MNRRRFALWLIVVVELIVVAGLVVGRRNSPSLPLVDLRTYHDSQTANELEQLARSVRGDSVESLTEVADALLAYGHYLPADACLSAAQNLAPKSREIAYQRGLCFERLGKLDEAKQQFHKVADQSSNILSSRAWYQLGRLALREEDASAAHTAFQSAGRNHWGAVYQRARLLARAGDFAQAKQLIGPLSDQHSEDLKVWQLVARIAEGQGNTKAARNAYDRANRAISSLNLDDTELYLRPIRKKYGIVREFAATSEGLRKGTTREPAIRLGQQLMTDPLWENTYLNVIQDAAEYALLARNEEVAEQLLNRQETEQRFLSYKYWELRGDLHELRGETADAYAAFEQASRQYPRRAGLQTKLSLSAAKLNKRGAEFKARRNAMLQAGIDLYLKNEIRDAGPIFGELAAGQPPWAEAFYYLGECERLRGDPHAARSAYQACLDLHPENGRAQERLAWVLEEIQPGE